MVSRMIELNIELSKTLIEQIGKTGKDMEKANKLINAPVIPMKKMYDEARERELRADELYG